MTLRSLRDGKAAKTSGLRSVLTSVFLFLLLFSGEAFAATYYVSPAGSDANSGSASAPFKTVQKAANVVNPGDTVIVKDGVYTDTDGNGYAVYLNRGGTSASWITFRSEKKWGAVLDGRSTTSNGWGFGTNARYLRIEDFEVKNMRNHGFIINQSTMVSNIYLYQNKVHDIGRYQVLCSDTSYKMGRTGVYANENTSDLTFDSNLWYNIGRLPGSCVSDDYNHDHGLYMRTDNLTVINNVFYNCLAGWPIQLDGGASNPGGMHNIDILNNTFYGDNPGANGHIILWYDVGDITIQNNISHTNGGYFLHNRTQQKYNWPDSYGRGNVYNNLVYGGTVYNYTPTKNWTASGNIEGKDPKFANLGAYDFHLQAGSPAIDKGAYVAEYVYDADGNPISGTPDIGAYEYGQTVPPTADVTAPSVPTGLSAPAVSSSQVNLTWSASTDNVGVAGYKVYRGISLIATTTTTSFSDAGLSPSTTYTYKVSAFDAAGNVSAQSAAATATTQGSSDTTVPTVPAGLAATVVSSSQINLTWSASTDNVGVAGYRVYRGGSLIATTTSRSFLNTGLSPSTTYSYWVSAFDAAGNVSAQSAAATATTQGSSDTTVPTVPAGLAATVVSSSKINLTWSASTDNVGVAGYKVYRGTSLIATTTAMSFSDSGLSPSTSYTYSVSAFDAAGNISVKSVSVSATTTSSSDAQSPPTKPSGLSATAVSSSQIKLTWTASTDNVGVAGYRVYRGLSLIATTSATSFSDAGLSPSATYTYKVSAYDAAGLVSAQSSPVSATTLPY